MLAVQKQQNANRQTAARVCMFDLLSCLKVECEWNCADRFGCVRKLARKGCWLCNICPSVRTYRLFCIWTVSCEILYWGFLIIRLMESNFLYWTKISTLCMKPSVRLIVAGDIQWSQIALLKWSDFRQLE